MKTESTVMYILRLTVTLLLITSVVAAALAGVNAVTAPKIAELKAAKTQKAIETVLPGGYEAEITDFTDETGLVTKVYSGINGFAYEVTPSGFDNTIKPSWKACSTPRSASLSSGHGSIPSGKLPSSMCSRRPCSSACAAACSAALTALRSTCSTAAARCTAIIKAISQEQAGGRSGRRLPWWQQPLPPA